MLRASGGNSRCGDDSQPRCESRGRSPRVHPSGEGRWRTALLKRAGCQLCSRPSPPLPVLRLSSLLRLPTFDQVAACLSSTIRGGRGCPVCCSVSSTGDGKMQADTLCRFAGPTNESVSVRSHQTYAIV